jgi:hypothetical protein
MKSVERRFNEAVQNNPGWSTLTCFANAIHGQWVGKDRLGRWFNKLVDPEDYDNDAEVKKELIAWMKMHTFEESEKVAKTGTVSNAVPLKKSAEAYVKQGGVRDLKGLVFRI